MIKLIFNSFIKNIRLYIGTFLSVFIVSMTVGGCLNLISGCITSADKGLRVEGCEAVISVSDEVVINYEDDGKIKSEKEHLTMNRPFSEQEKNSALQIIGKQDYCLDYTFKTDSNLKGNIYGHNFSALRLSNFSLKEGRAPLEGEVSIQIWQ